MESKKLFSVALKPIDSIGPIRTYKVWGNNKADIREFFVVTIETSGMSDKLCVDSIEEEKLN